MPIAHTATGSPACESNTWTVATFERIRASSWNYACQCQQRPNGECERENLLRVFSYVRHGSPPMLGVLKSI